MDAKILNTIGLLFSIIGGVIWFFYGFPQPTHEEGAGLALEDGNVLNDGRTVGEHNEEIRKTKKLYLCRSKVALVMIIIGFVFQLLGTWR